MHTSILGAGYRVLNVKLNDGSWLQPSLTIVDIQVLAVGAMSGQQQSEVISQKLGKLGPPNPIAKYKKMLFSQNPIVNFF